jgi:hypothetical protein
VSPKLAELVLDRPAETGTEDHPADAEGVQRRHLARELFRSRRAIGVTIVPSLSLEVASAAAVRSIHGSPKRLTSPLALVVDDVGSQTNNPCQPALRLAAATPRHNPRIGEVAEVRDVHRSKRI